MATGIHYRPANIRTPADEAQIKVATDRLVECAGWCQEPCCADDDPGACICRAGHAGVCSCGGT